MAQHLEGTAPLLPPGAARALYAREFRPILWSPGLARDVSHEFRALKDRWKFDPKPDTTWGASTPFTTAGGKAARAGNCNDFAPELKRVLMLHVELPDESLRLVLCTYDGAGHMVLALVTDAGCFICCNIVGTWPLGAPALQRHEYLAWEAPGRPWESLVPAQAVTLAEAIKGEKSS
jgi:hypothetical protein